MTFLLFLVSVAVLEYVLSRPERPPAEGTVSREKAAGAEPVTAQGLFSLGRAIEQYGRGTTPGVGGQVPEVRAPETDQKTDKV